MSASLAKRLRRQALARLPRPDLVYVSRFYRRAMRARRSGTLAPWHLLWAYRHGLLPGQVVEWGLAEGAALPANYLSERQRLWVEHATRTDLDRLFEDKILFHTLDLGLNAVRCGCRGMVIEGRYFPNGNGPPDLAGQPALQALTQASREEPLVVKPALGNSSRDVVVLGTHDLGLTLSMGRRTREARAVRLNEHARSVVTTLARPGAYARAIAPGLESKVEVLVARPEPGAAPQLRRAVHRFPAWIDPQRAKSRPVLLSAAVDVASGTLGPAMHRTRQGSSEHQNHPDSGAPIEGIRLPHWHSLVEHLLACLDRHLAIPFLVCDVILSDEGPRVIEAERTIDVTSLQTHAPLGDDPVLASLIERARRSEHRLPR